jgi:arylsulfatase A-like enzyme/Tfp pilus assembly protein PilF
MKNRHTTELFSSLALLFGFGLGFVSCGTSETPTDQPPNLLLITVDTTRTDRLGLYGYEQAETPTLDALAERGVVFDEAYTPAPMTLPAHATLLTGLLPPQHGARVNGVHQLAPDIPTLSEQLKMAGYRTGAFIAAFVLNAKFGLDQGFDRYDDDLTGAYDQDVPEQLSSYRPGEIVVDSALEWLNEGDQEEPFFAWVHLYDVHFPWYPHGPDAESAPKDSGSYDGELTYADAQVGRLLDWLEQKGMTENTLVVAVADHGEGLGDHHEIEHAYLLNEEVLHVPWIMAGPGVKAGHRVSALVSLEDFAPTALELLGMPEAFETQGRSLAPAMRGESLDSGMAYAETDLPWTSYRWAPQRSLTTEKWKYIRTPLPELYDRETDRAELVNMVEVRSDIRDKLEARLGGLEDELGERESDAIQISSDELAQLAALGYVGEGGSAEVPKAIEGLPDMKQRFGAKDLSAELRRGLADKSIEPVQALEMSRELVRLSPETPTFRGELGAALVNAGEIDAGIAEMATRIALDPGSANAHYDLGDTLQQQNRQIPARHAFEAALAIDPDHSAANVGMGNVLRTEGRPDLAAGYYTRAIQLRPGYAEAYYNLAQTFLDRGEIALAEDNLRLAIDNKPGWGRAHSTLANLLAGEGRTQEAIPEYEAALAASGDDADLHNDLGVALDAVGQSGKARQHYEAAIRANPAFHRPHINMANQSQNNGNQENTLASLEEALRVAPDLPETNTRLARFLATCPDEALRDPERAVGLAERSAEWTRGGNPRVLDTLSTAYAAAGRFPEAIGVARRAREQALSQRDQPLAREIETHLNEYAAGRPFIAN